MESKKLFQNNHKTVLAANHVVDRIVERGARRLYGKYLMTQMPQHLAYVHRKQTESVIFQLMFPNDTGEKIDTIAMYWCEEEQPEHPNLDSWGALSLKAQYRLETPVIDLGSKKSFDSGSRKSLSPNNFGLSTKRPNTAGGPMSMRFSVLFDGTLSQKNPTKNKGRAKSARIKPPKQVFEIQKAHDPEHDPEPDDPKIDQMRFDREIEKKKRSDEIEIKKQKAVQEKEREEARKMIDLRFFNREYTYGFDGKIMMVRPTDVETLPDTPFEPRTKTKKPAKVIQEVSHTTKNLDVKDPSSPKIYGAPNRFDKLKNSKAEFLYPKTPLLQEIFDPVMGVKLSMKDFQRAGPDILRPNQMSKQEYFKIIDSKQEQQKDHYKKLAADPDFVDNVLEQAMRKEEDKITKELDEAYANSPQQVGKIIEKKTPIKVHDQEKLVKMLAEIAIVDPEEKKEEHERLERHKQKIMHKKIVEEDQKRAQEILDRVSSYERNLQGELVTKKSEEKMPLGLHRNIEDFNKKIAMNVDWGYTMLTERRKIEIDDELARVVYAQKRKMKPQVFELHTSKEPRERQAVHQKLINTVSQKDIRPRTANKPFTEIKTNFNHQTLPKDLNKFSKTPRVLTQPNSTEDNTKQHKKKVSIANLPQISLSKLTTPRHIKSPSAMTVMTVKSTTAETQISASGFESARATEKKKETVIASSSRRSTKTEILTGETTVRPQTQAGTKFSKK